MYRLKDIISLQKLNELVDPMRSAASNTHESEDKLATPSPTSVQSTEPSASALSPQAETKDEKLKRYIFEVLYIQENTLL